MESLLLFFEKIWGQLCNKLLGFQRIHDFLIEILNKEYHFIDFKIV